MKEKHFRWFKTAVLSMALFTGFAFYSCDSEDGMIPNDRIVQTKSPLSAVTITKGAVSVRKGPGQWYERIGGLHYGKTVEVIKEQGGWLNIKYGYTDGWIYRSHTNFISTLSTVGCTAETANFIRDYYPDGYNIIFAYNGTDQTAEFHSQAEKFSTEYHTLNVSGGALEKDIYRKVKTYAQLKEGILETGRAVVKCLEDHPRPGFDDSRCSQIKNLTVMSHGSTAGLNLGSDYFNISLIPDFATSVYGYLNNSVLGIQLYASDTARKSGTSADWFDRYTDSVVKEIDPFENGEGSFAQMLSLEMGPEVTVFGHTTAGHPTNNYGSRCYGKLAGGAVNGKHMFDVYFPQSFVAEQAVRIGVTEDSIRTSMFNYYRRSFGGDNYGRDTFMAPEGKGKKMRDGWLSENP